MTTPSTSGSKWPRLRKLADHLYQIAEDGAQEKTASEIESEMAIYLLGELGPLLELAKESAEFIRNDEVYKGFKQEIDKWQK
jgi:methionine synthase I (cobalamin-dependent)